MRRPGNAGGRAGAGYGGVGRRQSPECPPAQPLMPGSSGINLERVLGGDAGPAGSTGQRGKEVIPGVCHGKQEKPALSTHLPHLWKALSILPTSPPCQDAHNTEEQYISKGLLASLKQAGQERPLDSCSSWASGRAGGGWEQPVLEVQGRGREDTGGAGQGPRTCTHAGWSAAGWSQVLAAL